MKMGKKRFKELTLKEELQWLNIMLVASPKIAENKYRLRECQELIIQGYAIALNYDVRIAKKVKE